MHFESINWLAAIVCLVLNIIIGSVWYGPKTFFPVWWKSIGKTENDKPNGKPLTWILLVVAGIVQIIFVALTVQLLGIKNAASGALAGFLLWIGFVASTGLVTKLFPGQLKAWVIEEGHHLINFLVFGIIFGAWH